MDWFEKMVVWILVLAFLLVSLALGIALFSPKADAGTVRLKWTNPTTEQEPGNCRHEGTFPLNDFAGTKWWAVRFRALQDTLYLGFIPTPIDSADFAFADSVTMGEILCKTVDTHGNMPCVFASRVFVLPLGQ